MVLLLKEKRPLRPDGGSFAIVIPAAMLDELKWKPGDELTIDLEEKTKGKFVSIYKG